MDGSAAGRAAAGSGGEKAEMEKSRRNSDSDAGAAAARGGGEMAEMEKSRRSPALAAAISRAFSFVSVNVLEPPRRYTRETFFDVKCLKYPRRCV